MSAWAKPGVKCVCINSDWKRGQNLSVWQWLNMLIFGLPISGGVYVITGVGSHAATGEVAITLKGWGDTGFHVRWFRPLVTRTQEQDVAIFRPLLNTIGEDA